MGRRGWPLLLVVLCGLLAAVPAQAHFATVSFVELSATRDGLTGRLLLDPYHLATVLPLDGDGDTYVAADELAAVAEDVRDLAAEALVARVAGTPLPLVAGEPRLTDAATLGDHEVPIQPDFALVEVPLTYATPPGFEAFTLAYDLFLDPDDGTGTHHSFALIELDGRALRHVFGPQTPTLRAVVGEGASLASMAPLGIALIGLVALLPLAARLVRRPRTG